MTVAMLALAAPAQAIEVRGSVEQVAVTGADPGAKLALTDSTGKTVARRTVNPLGATLFRNVKPGAGYQVGDAAPMTVMPVQGAPPDTKVYDQQLPEKGYGYLTTRDGTQLAINVHPPTDVTKALPGGIDVPAFPGGESPTLIEYAGYGYANPKGPESGIQLVANLMGFTVVDVNMRGTGCSGGAFDFFEPLQGLDGYDVIETVARQPWVAHGKVGMMGISYGGISQLFTAQYDPPSLAAISPLSVIDNTQTTLYPGGILNTGFAFNWAKERVHDAQPASEDGGQKWAHEKIQAGDQVCKDNQALHGEAVDLLKKIKANRFYKPKVADPLAPVTFVDKIKVPTFMACQFTDEQTGGHCPTLASRLTGTDKKWFTFTNGVHTDSLAPEILNRWFDFLQIYVAKQSPALNSVLIRATAPVVYEEAQGIPGMMLPADPIQSQPTLAAAQAAFEAQPRVRVLFDNGAGGATGRPVPAYEHGFSAFPPAEATAKTWFFGAGGTLGDAPGKAAVDRFRWNRGSDPLTNFTGNTAGGKLWTENQGFDWAPRPDGTGVAYTSAPLAENVTALGSGFVRAWVKSSRPDADLQVTVTEVRPDGNETFVQGGWLRGNARVLDKAKSKPLEPVLSLRERDARPLPRKRFAKVTIPLYYQGHAYRAGSRIRVTVSAPNGDQPIWAFARTAPRKGGARVAVRTKGSRLTLPVVPGLEVPTPLPPCPSLRNEPCRKYVPAANETTAAKPR